ncbi:MAG: hypothetical protein NVSMB57_01390 [Actinomycetota bacterium]
MREAAGAESRAATFPSETEQQQDGMVGRVEEPGRVGRDEAQAATRTVVLLVAARWAAPEPAEVGMLGKIAAETQA